MDEKKLAELHAWLQTKGAKNLPEVDVFISKANADNGKKLHDILYNAGATKLDYDSFSNEYKSAVPAPELKSANPFDLMREVVSEKPVTEKEVSPVDYYNQAKPQPHAELVDGEPQNVLGLLSPDKKKIKEMRPKTGDFDINAQPIGRDNVVDVYGRNIKQPENEEGFFFEGREESDPIKTGVQKYAEQKRAESPTKQLESIVEATRPKIDKNNALQVHAARYQKAINRDKSAITNIVNTTVNPTSQTEENGIMDYILPKSDLSQLSSATEALVLNKSAEAIQQRLDKGEILSRTQSEALKIAQKRAGSPDASPKELARIMQAIEENDDKTLLNYVAPLDREFAKTAYNDIDKGRTAAAYKKRPNELTSQERLGFWFGITKYNQQREDKDDPAYLPYIMLAQDDQNISQQIERLRTLFPDQKEGAMSLEPPKGLAAQFPKPAERTYAYYQILANRYTQLTKELQNESISMDREDKANLLDERLKANSILQGAAMFLPIVGVQDVTNPKVKEWYSVLNKINALAPMIRNAKVGAAENEAQDYTLNRFTNATAEAALDIYGAPYERTDRARIAGEQSEVINDAEINTKTGMNPESIAILKERSKSGDIDDLATWGNAAGGFAGIMMPFMAAGMVGGNKLQSATQGLSRLDKGSQIGKILLNAEGGITKTGWLAQKAINLGMTGLQYEYAGAISGEGKDLRNELRFSQGVLGYAGSQALTGSLGLLMKGGMKLGGKFVSKIPYFEKGIKAIEDAYGSKYANYAKAYLANGFSELGEEIPQDWRNNLEEVKGDDVFQKMLAAAQKTADDIAYDDVEGKYSLSKTLGYALPIIAMGGKYDGIGVEDVHKISDWAVTFGEQITGEKTSEEDKRTIREFSDFIADQAGQSPANVRFTDKGTLFTLDGKEYLYNAETQSVTSRQGVTEPEKQNAVNVAQEMMANYNKAIKEGDFTGLFGENVRPYNKQNEETAIPQPQEVPVQEIVQETPEIAEQEAPIVESAEATQEAPEVEAAEIEQPPQKTAEELDVRRGEIESRLPQIEAELEALRSKPILESTEEDADMEDFLLAEQADLQNEFEDIAETRKTVRTAKETEIEQEAQRVEALTQKTQRVADIEGEIAQIEEASKALPIRERLSAKANIEALSAEKEALSAEIEALQPKKETPTVRKNLTVETPIAETPIIAETPQLETPIVESKKKEPEPIQKEAEEKLPEVDSKESVTNKKADIEKRREDELNNRTIVGRFPTTEDGEFTIEGNSGIFRINPILNKIEQIDPDGNWRTEDKTLAQGLITHAKKHGFTKRKKSIDAKYDAELAALEKQESNPPKLENKQPEKVAETPVAPAAPKEQKPQPEKGTRKIFNPAKPKPQKPEAPKEPTTIKPVKSGSELAEMLGNTEQAIETGKVWDRVAKMWAKKTGKTVEDWWNRIESIQVGGEGQKGSVKFENGKFIVFLATDRDVSTPVHELAHIFQTDLSESEKKSVVNWYNKGNKTNHKVTDWGFAENETSRNISEYFAEGFVEWLKEGGKTTDKAMQSVFEKFKDWLKDVVNTVFTAKVELNEDMRAIYEQIFTEAEKKAIEAEKDKTPSDITNNTLYQTDPYHKSLEDWLVGEISAETLQSNPEELRAEAFDEIVGDVGKDVANEIIDRAFNRILYPITDAEKKLSEHADKIEAKAEAVRAVEMESLPQAQIDELREVAKKEGETITDSTTQEERIEIRNRLIDDFVGKGMTQQAAEQLVGQYIRERSFGSKFREKYAPQMSKELRDAVMDKTYLYGVVSNASAIQKAQALVNDWYERAIEQAANEWGDKADPKNEDFVADTYEKLMDVINNELFGSKVTTDYYVKVAAALYATKLADTLAGNLKGNAKTRVIDKLVTLVGQLAELGNIFGKTINMFGVMTNVKGGVLQAIFNKEMSAVIANMSKTQKTAKDAIESVINGVSDMVEGLKSGSDKGLLQDLADAMQNNPAIDRLLEKIVQNATNEQEVIDILDKIDGLEADKTALEKEIKDKKVLEEKIKEKNKEIATLKRKLADKPAKTPTKKAEAQKAAVKTKYESLIDDVVSFGKNLFENRLYQKIQGFESTLLDTYREEVINKVNAVMKNITDYVYLGNENASPTNLYEMIQDAARKEFAQKYLEKADIQPDIPINTNPNLTKTEEARNEAARKKNAEKAAQKQLHTDILDAIDNNKFKASIEQYIQENREKDIRNQMRKRVVGIVNNTEITEKDKKVELRKALAQMVAEAATSTNEAAKGIKDFMRTYFDVGGKDVSEFEQEFDRLWEAQVKRKQQELIKKRLQTSDEKEQKLTDKAVAELLENLEKDKEFGHKFMEDLAKNVRITQGNWEAETAKRFREHYHIPLLTQANQKKIADMIKYVDSLPNDSDAKQGAMDVIMTEYLNIVGVENIDRWVSLIDVMFHVNNLLNFGTQWQNIKDSLYQVLHNLALPVANFFGEVVTAMRESGNILNVGFVGQLNRTAFLAALNRAQRGNLINAKTVWKTLFSQSTYRLIYNQFSVKEARAIGEYSSFMDYFAKNFAELPRKLKGFQFKSALDFIQYGIPAGLMTLYDGIPLSTITNALLSGFDMALGNTLQMGRMANILSRKGIASQEAMDLADISKAGSRRMEYNGKTQTIDEILTDERSKGYFAKQEQIVDMWNKAIAEGKTEAEAHNVIKEAVSSGEIQSEYKREWRRKMQLFADYVEQEHAAWIIADTYRKNATYKNDPTGVLGWIYNGVNTALVRNLRQSEIEAREAYKRDETAANLAKQKGAQLLKIGAERILGTAYFRTKINIFNKQKLNSFFGSLITAIKNYVPYMDTEAAMKLAINKKGELKPNSLWYVDDLVNKGFLSEAKKKVQTDIDNIAGTGTANKEKVTKREDTQVEKIDNQIADKEKTLSEKIESVDKFSAQKQDAIDRKIDKRKEIINAFTEKMQDINNLFAEKRKKILESTKVQTEGLKTKMLNLLTSEIGLVEAAYDKKARVEDKIRDYTNKWEKLSVDIMLITKKIESEKEIFEDVLSSLKTQIEEISKQVGVEDKIALMDFAAQKEKALLELYQKRANPSILTKEKMLVEKQKTEMQFDLLLDEYKTKHENSAETIRKSVDKAIKEIEKDIEKIAQERDVKIQENTKAQNEAVQKAITVIGKRIASLDFELNVAINVEKERYDRQKSYLQRVFDTDKAKLEAEKKLIADRAKAERANIDDLAKTKSTPLSQDIAKIDKRIASHNESYRIGVADETARRIRIATVNTTIGLGRKGLKAMIGYGIYKTLASVLGGDDDDEEPFIEVVGDITPADNQTKAQRQNQKEANSKKKLIIRAFGRQMSYNFASTTMIYDLLMWGEIFDMLHKEKIGIVSDKNIADVALRPILTSYQQIFAFRDAGSLNFMSPYIEPSERVVEAVANLSPIKVPSQIRQIASDFVYKGQQYTRPENEAYFQQYLRLIGMHPELISTENRKYAVQNSMIDGQPIHRYAGDNNIEIDRLLSTAIWGKETATSFNEFTVKPDRFNVLYKEMEFKKWLFDRGLTDAINITNPKDIVPKVADNILLGLDPLPQDEFQENIVKPTAMQASDKLREMYKSGKYNGKSKDDIIEKVKANTMGEEVAKEYLESDRSNEAAFNIGLKYIVKDIWEGTQKEVLGAYLKTKPRYKLPSEKTQAYKDRLELK